MTDDRVHPQALCESTNIGAGTRVGAFSHVRASAAIGDGCDVGGGVFIEDDVVVEDDAVLGTNATILAGVRIGRRAIVQAGAVVTRNVPPNAIVSGNPAHIAGYTQTSVGSETEQVDVDIVVDEPDERVILSSVRGVSIHRLRLVRDMRGDLSVGEFNRDVPFDVARYFVVFHVPSSDVRGEHAHRECVQFLLCVKGSCAVVVDDGTNRAEIALHEPHVGLLIPPMVWGTQYKFSADAVLLVFASHLYDPDDYIRDFDEFLVEVGTSTARG